MHDTRCVLVPVAVWRWLVMWSDGDVWWSGCLGKPVKPVALGVGFERVRHGRPGPIPVLPIPGYPRGFVNPWRALLMNMPLAFKWKWDLLTINWHHSCHSRTLPWETSHPLEIWGAFCQEQLSFQCLTSDINGCKVVMLQLWTLLPFGNCNHCSGASSSSVTWDWVMCIQGMFSFLLVNGYMKSCLYVVCASLSNSWTIITHSSCLKDSTVFSFGNNRWRKDTKVTAVDVE